jgi:hypothetical protein
MLQAVELVLFYQLCTGLVNHGFQREFSNRSHCLQTRNEPPRTQPTCFTNDSSPHNEVMRVMDLNEVNKRFIHYGTK